MNKAKAKPLISRHSFDDSRTSRQTTTDRRQSLNDELQGRRHIMTEDQRLAKLKSQKNVVERLSTQSNGSKKTQGSRDSCDTLTPSQIESLKNTFRKLDVDQDGRISKRDLRIACRKLGLLLTKDELQELYAEADIDGKGVIDYKTYEQLVGHQVLIANYKNQHLMNAFKHFDKDGNGYITGDEIQQVFKDNGVELDEDEVAALIEEADANKDGVISFEEFVHSVVEKDW